MKQISLPQLPYGQRTDAFRRLLYELKFQPLKTFAELQLNPSESVLIVLGDPSCLSRGYFPEGLMPFVQQGGAVLIATDKKTEGEVGKNLVSLAGVNVTGETLMCLRPNPADLYGTSPYCPFVQPVPDSTGSAGSTNVLGALATIVGAGGQPVLFRNPRPDQPDLRVATNAPSRLQQRGWWLPGGIQRLAYLPLCEDETKALHRPPVLRIRPDNQPEASPRPLFAVGGTMGEGRVLVLADHSVFINRMILPRDTGNLEFAANCLHWLRGGASTPIEMLRAANSPQAIQQITGQRDKVLFWDDGQIRTDFRVPMREIPINPSLGSEPAIVAAVNQTVMKMEDQNALNRNLLDGLDNRDWSLQRLGRYAVYALTLALLLFLGYVVVWRGRYRLDASSPLLEYVAAQHEPRLSLLEQRRRAMLRTGNVWETAHQLARQCFESAGIPLTGTSAPRIALRGGWWQTWRIRRRIARLWSLAQGDTPMRISPIALKRWLREMEELKTALVNAEIRMQNAE
ncbi:MAG TPA: hypothetical protein VN688_19525 [Gemmataceae bacterium]|nr:hypothetical protein [Gemmataceae bacterium]